MAVRFFTGYETGDASQLAAALPAGATIDTGIKRTGSYSLKCPSTAAASEIQIVAGLNTATLFSRFSVYIAHNAFHASLGVDFYACILRGTADTNLGYVLIRSNPAGYYEVFIVNGVGGTNVSCGQLSTAVQHLFEFKYTVSATVGILELKIDGFIVGTLSSQNTGTENIDRFRHYVGNSLNDGVNYFTAYYDDLLLDDAAYPGNGRSIARQGKAGTPNADAWTKTSSQTAAQVWSETPFSATNEAHSTAASQAQTMLVADVGAGTDPITDGSIINACSVGAIMKEISSGTTRTYSIRRRVGGANTDTAKVLTASDAYYNDGIWTASRADLQAAEIGGVRGTGTGKHMQIEDCWLFVDYSPPVTDFFRRRVG